MQEIIRKPFLRPGNWLLWLGVILIARIIIIAFFIQSSKTVCPERLVNGFILKQNDYEYFLAPVDEYFNTGTLQMSDSPGKAFAGRMPGYSFPYMLLRFVFEKEIALSVLILFQILFGAISVYMMSYLAGEIFQNRISFFITAFLFGLNAPVILFDVFTLAESFSVSAVCFFLFFTFKYFKSKKIKYILIAGFFVAWTVFLRPFLGLLLMVFPLALLFYERKKYSFKKIVWLSFLFGLPFLVFESAWICRNYNALGKFIPLETALSESYGERGKYRTSAISIRKLIQAWGGETGEFYEGSEANWFHETPITEAHQYSFAPYVFNSVFNKDSLIELKRIFNSSIDYSFTEHQKDSLNMHASNIALRFASHYKQDNIFRYYAINPVKRFCRLVFANTTRLLPLPRFNNMNLVEKSIKLFALFLSYFAIVVGFAAMIWILIISKMKNPVTFVMVSVPIVLILTLVFFSDIIEFRYFLSALPVFIIFTSQLVSVAVKRFCKNVV